MADSTTSITNVQYDRYIKGHVSSSVYSDMIATAAKTDVSVIGLVLLLIKSTVLFICSRLLKESLDKEKEIDKQLAEQGAHHQHQSEVNDP